MLPTASGVDRAHACDASNVLPRVRSSNRYSRRGQIKHRFMLRARLEGRAVALAEIPADADERPFCERIPLEKLPQGGELEVAFAWDWTTDEGRVLGIDLDRNYAEAGATPTEFCGTADLVGLLGDVVIVIDWKTGFRSLGDPALSGQLRLLALAAARAYNVTRARVAFFYLREDGTFAEDWADFEFDDLIEIADELRELALSINAELDGTFHGVVPTATVGDHCTYCPSATYCPAQALLARSMLAELDQVDDPFGELTAEQAATVWIRLEAFEKVAERIKAGIKTIAATQPITLADGRVLGEVMWPTTVLDKRVALPVLRELGGDAAVDEALGKVTQAGISRALGDRSDEALSLIQARGGLNVVYSPRIQPSRSRAPRSKKRKTG